MNPLGRSRSPLGGRINRRSQIRNLAEELICRAEVDRRSYAVSPSTSTQSFTGALKFLISGDLTYQMDDGSGRRYYVMSKLFQDVAEECLVVGNRRSANN